MARLQQRRWVVEAMMMQTRSRGQGFPMICTYRRQTALCLVKQERAARHVRKDNAGAALRIGRRIKRLEVLDRQK